MRDRKLELGAAYGRPCGVPVWHMLEATRGAGHQGEHPLLRRGSGPCAGVQSVNNRRLLPNREETTTSPAGGLGAGVLKGPPVPGCGLGLA